MYVFMGLRAVFLKTKQAISIHGCKTIETRRKRKVG
jgi:hypothetical protein